MASDITVTWQKYGTLGPTWPMLSMVVLLPKNDLFQFNTDLVSPRQWCAPIRPTPSYFQNPGSTLLPTSELDVENAYAFRWVGG
jgi:hypothetical protein